MRKKQLLLLCLTLVLSLYSFANSGIYLMGTINNWNPLSEWEFIDEGNGVYTLYDKEIKDEFKIASSDWSTHDYGAIGDANIIELNKSLDLMFAGRNINCNGILKCTKITLTLPEEGNPIILIEGSETIDAGIYLRGDFNEWAALSEWEFIYEGNGVYALYDKEISNNFKIGSSNWEIHNYGAIEGANIIDFDTPFELINGGNNITCNNTLKCSKITLTLPNEGNPTLLLEGYANSSGIYLRGDVNSWETPTDWEFIDEGNGVYTLTDKILSGSFKIGDSKWQTCNYGLPNSNNILSIGNETVLEHNGNNIILDNICQCNKITFTILNDGTATLLIEGAVLNADKPTEVYVIGDNNRWAFNDNSGKLIATDNEDEYKGEVTFNISNDLCYWRIYEGLGGYGSWGNPGGNNMTEHTTSGTLERNSEGSITTKPGKYTITFNLNSGEFKAEEDVSGLNPSAIEEDEFAFDIVDGILYIRNENPVDITIHSYDGKMILSDKAVTKADLSMIDKGIYILKIKASNKEKAYKLKL